MEAYCLTNNGDKRTIGCTQKNDLPTQCDTSGGARGACCLYKSGSTVSRCEFLDATSPDYDKCKLGEQSGVSQLRTGIGCTQIPECPQNQRAGGGLISSGGWTAADCAKAGGEWLPEGGKTSGDFCYTKQDINYTPSIRIGSATIKNLGDYISQIYTYSLGFVAMLAVIMLMVGGLQWVMARGGPGVGAAKKRIGNAILGVVILSAAYLILNTISPAIVKLSLPRIPKIKPQKFTFSEKFGQQMDKNDICYTIRDKDICGSGMQCVPLRTIDQLNSDDMPCGQIMKANEAIVAVGVALLSGGAGGSASTLAATAKTAGQVALKGGGKIIGFVSRYPKTTVAALLVGTGYVKATAPDPAWGEEGRCWPLTTGTVPRLIATK